MWTYLCSCRRVAFWLRGGLFLSWLFCALFLRVLGSCLFASLALLGAFCFLALFKFLPGLFHRCHVFAFFGLGLLPFPRSSGGFVGLRFRPGFFFLALGFLTLLPLGALPGFLLFLVVLLWGSLRRLLLFGFFAAAGCRLQ